MEENISGFQGSVKIPNEIRDVKNTVIFGLTGRQLGFAVLALFIVGVLMAILYGAVHLDMTVAIIISLIPAAIPFSFGFVRPGGIPMEDWALIQWSNYIKSAPVRKLEAENSYELAERLGKEKVLNEEKLKKGKTAKKREKKQKPKKSAYTFRK